MAMSDCEKCWETPCVCGHEYRHWSLERLSSHIEMLKWVMIGKAGAGIIEGLKNAPDALGALFFPEGAVEPTSSNGPESLEEAKKICQDHHDSLQRSRPADGTSQT